MEMDQIWINVNGVIVDFPLFVETFKEAKQFYNSVYDANQCKRIAPTIGMPQNEMLRHVYELSKLSKQAGNRTKEQLESNNKCNIL